MRCSLNGETSKQRRLECSSGRETMNLLMSRSRNNEISKHLFVVFGDERKKNDTKDRQKKHRLKSTSRRHFDSTKFQGATTDCTDKGGWEFPLFFPTWALWKFGGNEK